MADQLHIKFKNNFLYWGLVVYVLCILAFPSSRSGIDAIRIPSFALLLLILVQVIFPGFRFSKTANVIAIALIVGLGFLTSSSLMTAS